MIDHPTLWIRGFLHWKIEGEELHNHVQTPRKDFFVDVTNLFFPNVRRIYINAH